MTIRRLKQPSIIIAIGLVLALTACLFTNIVFTPTITEQEFNYSVTYKLNGETKTLEGIYKCNYDGYREGSDPSIKYYTGEYIVDGQSTYSHTYTIAEKDGAKLYIVTLFNNCYLMDDKKNENYVSFLNDPFLEAIDKEGAEYDKADMPAEFNAEIISWDYPEPIENTFKFSGFSLLHAKSMVVMLGVGLLVIVACIIFVKRDKTVPYKSLDILAIIFNIAICFAVLPFITIVTFFLPITMSADEIIYQIFLCIPAFTAFTVAASISLRRIGFTKTGLFIQFAGPVLFFIPILLEPIL